MARKSVSNKYVELEDVRLSLSPKDDRVRLTSSDPDLDGEFIVTLSQGTPTEESARELLKKLGVTTKHVEALPSIDMIPILMGNITQGGDTYLVNGAKRSGRNTFIKSVLQTAQNVGFTTFELTGSGVRINGDEVERFSSLDSAADYNAAIDCIIEANDYDGNALADYPVVSVSQRFIDRLIYEADTAREGDNSFKEALDHLLDLNEVDGVMLFINVEKEEARFRELFSVEDYYNEILFDAGPVVRYEPWVYDILRSKPKFSYLVSNPFPMNGQPSRVVGFSEPRV
jgi:hypothetical protein